MTYDVWPPPPVYVRRSGAHKRCADVLGFTNGVQLLVANTPSEYVSACLKLYGDPALRHHLVFEGQKSVRERFSWNSVSKQMLNNYSCRFIP